MEKSKSVKILLFISGIIGIIIGSGMAFVPVSFQSSAGIILGENISLLSETRAPGLLLFLSGIIILVSAFKSNWRHLGLVLTSLMYLGYGLGRTISLAIDGMPNKSLFLALILELIIGGIAFYVLRRFKKSQSA